MSIRERVTAGLVRLIKAVNNYDAGGQRGRRVRGWNPGSAGPRSALSGSLVNLRNRSRDQIRNNGLIAHGVTSLVTNEIGTGIVPRSRAKDDDLRLSINALWALSSRELDADGVLDIYGQQSLCSRTRTSAGEVFIRRRPRRASDKLHVPLQVQLLEPEFVPVDLNRKLNNGNEIACGIEFDRRGRRVAYHMYREHPGDASGFSAAGDLLRIPARDVIHHYMPLRPGQIRGEPGAATSLLSARDFHEYVDAELMRKKTRAPYSVFLKRPAIEYGDDTQLDPLTGLPNDTEDDIPTMSQVPGSIMTGLPGEEPILFDGDDNGNGYADYIRNQIMGMAAGMNLPYELMSGDWSKVNDRLVRVVLNEFHRYIESIQDHYMIHQVCGGIWNWWMDAAVLSRALVIPGYASQRSDALQCEWRPQGWQFVHPVQDVDAKIKSIAAGLTSRQAEAAKSGWDVEEIDQQNREDQERSSDLNYQFSNGSQQDEKVVQPESGQD